MYLKISRFFIIILFCFSFLITISQTTTEKVKEYYTNGVIKVKGKLKNNEHNGFWYYYSEKGRLTKKERWKDGKLKWTIIYNEKQKPSELINEKGEIKKLKGCGC